MLSGSQGEGLLSGSQGEGLLSGSRGAGLCSQDLGVQGCSRRNSGCRAVLSGSQGEGFLSGSWGTGLCSQHLRVRACCQDLRVRASCQDLGVQGWSVWGRLGLLCLSAVRPHVFRVCGLTGPPIPHGRQPLGDSSGLNHLFSQEPLPAGTSWLPARLTTNPS